MKCGLELTAVAYFEFQKQKFSDLLLMALPVACVRIMYTRSLPIAKELSGLAPTAAFVALIHTRPASNRWATTAIPTSLYRFIRPTMAEHTPEPIAAPLFTTRRPFRGTQLRRLGAMSFTQLPKISRSAC